MDTRLLYRHAWPDGQALHNDAMVACEQGSQVGCRAKNEKNRRIGREDRGRLILHSGARSHWRTVVKHFEILHNYRNLLNVGMSRDWVIRGAGLSVLVPSPIVSLNGPLVCGLLLLALTR